MVVVVVKSGVGQRADNELKNHTKPLNKILVYIIGHTTFSINKLKMKEKEKLYGSTNQETSKRKNKKWGYKVLSITYEITIIWW